MNCDLYSELLSCNWGVSERLIRSVSPHTNTHKYVLLTICKQAWRGGGACFDSQAKSRDRDYQEVNEEWWIMGRDRALWFS